jgi:hypothetical protein
VKPFSFSSRAIGPKTRVPRGLFSLLIITEALSSKRKREPSLRRTDCLVLTITARTTSDRFTVRFGVASLTTPIITSPTCPYRRLLPRTRIHINFLAPLLSATLKQVWGCIIFMLLIFLKH